MRKVSWLAALAAGATLLIVSIPQGAGQNNEASLWRHRNLGKAFFEAPSSGAEAVAEFKNAVALAPTSFRDHLNYGLALLRAGDTAEGIRQLERVQKQNPRLPHTWFNLGIAYRHQGRYREAIRQLEHMLTLTPREPMAYYNLGLLYKLTGRGAQALQQFRKAANLDPHLTAPLFQIYEYYRLQGDEAAAGAALGEFRRAKEQQEAEDETEDTEWCAYAELYDPVQALPASPTAPATAALRFEDRPLAAKAPPNTGGLLTLDADGDGSPDLLVWSRDAVSLYRNGRDPVPDAGLSALRDVAAVVVGDYDNDGLADLCLLNANGVRLFHNNRGRFTQAAATLPDTPFRSAVWLDFDHDYDLDLFLLGDHSILLRNRGDGTFEEYTSHFPFVAGRAVSGVALHTEPETKAIDLAVAFDDRKGVLYRDRLRGEFETAPLDAVPPGAAGLHALDLDNDGWTDLTFQAGGQVSLALNRGARFRPQAIQSADAAVFADLENRGFADLATEAGVSRNQGLGRLARPTVPAGFVAGTAWTEADFDADGRTDLALIAKDGAVHVLFNRSATKNQWLRITLTGVKNLKLAAGAEVEVKAGDLYGKRTYTGVPLHFGLGGYPQVDTVRITWPNGMIQNQPNEPALRSLTVKEAPRLAGSCPMIFTWNGRQFEFLTDVLGVAPLGASAGDGNYFPVDHDEYVQIPAERLAARDGQYEIRITEELHEVSYLDQVQLIALDHPQAVEIFTNDKFKSPPFPEFRLFGVLQRIYPLAARDDHGRSVLPAILRRDRVYATGFGHDSAGAADLHSVTLDFGPHAAHDNRAVLLLDGWVDWADGSTFLGASQSPSGGLVFPYLQVKDGAGRWQTVVQDMGIPSGKPKTIAVDLTGKFLSASREVRIVTNLCVYWDEIFLGEDSAAPAARLTPLDAASANLRLRGFSQVAIHPRREQPESFDYAGWTPQAMWNQTPGRYTRYGDVPELIRAVDDRFTIMGAGDELRLLYPAAGLPPLPAGWRRDFLLLVDGWAKDSDANTAFSQTVEPLPFHAMSGYPYPAGERYPEGATHRLYRQTYNTRPALQFVPPVAPARRPSEQRKGSQ